MPRAAGLQFDAAELGEDFGRCGARFAVAPFRALFFARKLRGKSLGGSFFAEHFLGRALEEGDDAVDRRRASFEDVEQLGSCFFHCRVACVGGHGVFPCKGRILGDLRAS